MVYDQLYLGGTIDEDKSPVQTPTTVICAHGTHGNVADVYGETPGDSRIVAEQIVSVLSWLCDDDLLKQFCEVNGAVQVASSLNHSLGFGRLVDWQEIPQEDKEMLARVAYELLEDFRAFALAHNRDGEHIGQLERDPSPPTPGWYWLTNHAGPHNPYPVFVERIDCGIAYYQRMEPDEDNTKTYKGDVPLDWLIPINPPQVRSVTS